MNIIGKFMNAWLHPWGAMQGVRDEGEQASIVPSMVFIIVSGLISGLITAVMSMVFPPANLPASKMYVWLAVLIVPIGSFLGSFIAAFLIWGLVDGLLNGTMGQYRTAYRLLAVIAAFSPLTSLLGPIPKVGQWLALAVQIWGLIVVIQGIIIVRNTQPVRTWVICGVLFALLVLLSVFARQAAQKNLAGGGLGGFENGIGEDFGGAANGDLDKQLQDLANQAKQGGAASPAPVDSGTQKK